MKMAGRSALAQTWRNHLPRILWRHRECPLCTSVEFQAAESGAWDAILGWFALSPIRCGNCWRRYYSFSMKTR